MVTQNESGTDQQQVIAAAKQEVRNHKPAPKLPRLGQAKATRKIEELELPDEGASVVLRKPKVSAILDMQEKIDLDKANAREQYASTVDLIASMLVDPELTADQLRELTDELSFGDWTLLQDKALELAGIGEEQRQQTAGEFQRSQER